MADLALQNEPVRIIMHGGGIESGGMKHASAATMQQLEWLIRHLRRVPGLVERTSGAFYFRSSAFLHFHEDPAGLFADAKLDLKGFERHPVGTRAEQTALLERVIRATADAKGSAQSRARRSGDNGGTAG